MSNILTPLSLWNNFDVSAELNTEVVKTQISDGVTVDFVRFDGRDTGAGRVKIAAAYAYDADSPSNVTVMILPDGTETIDIELMKAFVSRGYSVLMVDYRGKWTDCDFYTLYPENIAYADYAERGRHYDFVDETAVETSWYEWVAVGLFARKYAVERTGSSEIALLGIRDGGEIAWKMAVADTFECIIPVSAAGWHAYSGINKYMSDEPELNEERYRFIGGIDSQAYAPYVKCPVLMLCSTNDERFDYDRAYDTFSRINPEFINGSAISFSVHSNKGIGLKSTADMFMFLDKYLKNRQVFIPKPAEVTIDTDGEFNLIAKVTCDTQGIPDSCGMYLAEDCVESSLREWVKCPLKEKLSDTERSFYLNVYEKTSIVFALCYVKYLNGFTVWSRTAAKKISGKFKNMQPKCRVMYSSKDGIEGFSVADGTCGALGGTFFMDKVTAPEIVEKDGVKGVYAKGGLLSFRMNNPRYSPSAGNILKMDIYCDEASQVKIALKDLSSDDEYVCEVDMVDGVWQSVILEPASFKTAGGVSLNEFSSNFKFTVTCDSPYAVNNVMWL